MSNTDELITEYKLRIEVMEGEGQLQRIWRTEVFIGARWEDYDKEEDVPWLWDKYNYRRKPKPREWWVVFASSGTPRTMYSDLEKAKSSAWQTDTIVRVREVQE